MKSHDSKSADPTGLSSTGAPTPPQLRGRGLEHWLASGSDARLDFDRGGRLNCYGCQASPRPHEISFSSSTASTISHQAFSAAEADYRALCQATTPAAFERTFGRLVARTRNQLKTLFDVNDRGVEVILSPSGTDSGLQALFLARQVLGRAVTSIIVAADETGSGVSLAAAGRHFAASSSGGRAVARGEALQGLGTDVSAIGISVRDQFGDARPIAEIDEDVQRSVAEIVAAGRGVLLHIMDHSKLGSRGPSSECVREICLRWGASVRIVVDACQGRLSRRRLHCFLDSGFMVLTTGSKFFTGPPLSGALFVPFREQPQAAGDIEMLAGLSDYSTRHDWPRRWTSVRDALPGRANIGQLLRWTAALEEIRAYFSVPELFRKIALSEFAARASREVAAYSNFRLLPQPEWLSSATENDEEFGVRTIFPFLVMHKGKPLTLAECRILHEAINQDLSELLPSSASIVRQICHIGQPVGIRDRQVQEAGAIRISADARLVSESWSAANEIGAMEKMRMMTARLRVVLEKIELTVPHIDAIHQCLPSRPAGASST